MPEGATFLHFLHILLLIEYCCCLLFVVAKGRKVKSTVIKIQLERNSTITTTAVGHNAGVELSILC